MSVNILADFTENGLDKNKPHIVAGTNDIYLAGKIVKNKIEDQGCIVQSLTVVDGIWTLKQLHDMANYGDNLSQANARVIYVSKEALEYFEMLKNCPEEREGIQQEIANRRKRRC